MSNHEEAIKYMNKSKILGKEILKLKLLDNDDVLLVEVMDKDYTGKVVIPSFITQVINYAEECYKPFAGCMVEEIYLDNKNGGCKDLSFLLSDLRSSRIKFSIARGECVTKAIGMFSDSRYIKDIEFGDFDASNIKVTSCMFEGCRQVTELDLSKLNMESIEDASYMFHKCDLLRYVTFGDINMKMIKQTTKMFRWCSSLESVNLGKMDTDSIENMESMFAECFSLKEVDLGNLRTTNLKDCRNMFYMCENLRRINIESFKPGDYLNNGMFEKCRRLREVKLGELGDRWKRSGRIAHKFIDSPHLFKII